jgi:hypothetical protein
MAEIPIGPGGPEEEALPQVEMEIASPEEFAGGVDITEDGKGGAILEALMGGEGMEVETEVYDHNANLAEVLDDGILGEMSSDLVAQYEEDNDSRSEWQEGYVKGLDLLGVKYEERTQPFAGASGVTHPLIAESVTQFQAQCYKELLPAGGPVKTQIIGMKDQAREEQATRVKDFMNYQITEVMEEFDPDTDQMLFYLPLSGSTFKKVYYDPLKQRAVAMFVPAEDMVIPYSASDISTSSRVTHVLRMDENQVRKLQVAGEYRDIELSSSYDESDDSVKEKIRELDGTDKSHTDDIYTILEMHVDLDIEGFEDMDQMGEPTGVKLPYIVTLDKGSGEVLSIRRNYAAQDPMKKKVQYFVHYKFLPGLGFYGFGLIHMIGGLGRAATSILRQLIDSGTLANLPAGFKARGLRIRNDDEPLNPGEFRDIDAPGGDIRNSIIPLPFKEPSATLAQLLGSLIDAGRRFVSIADQQTGQNMGKDMPVGTTVALLERGMKVMSAIHKRLHYAQKQEFRLLSRILAENLPPEYPYDVSGGDRQIKQSDFDGRVDVVPVSDPNIFSMAQRVTLAQTQLQLAQSNPQVHNLYQAYRRMYLALEVQNIDEVLPPPPQPQPLDPAIENARALMGELLQAFPEQDHDSHVSMHISFMKLPVVQTSPQVYGVFISHVMEHISLKARAMAQQELQQMQMQGMPVDQSSMDMKISQIELELTNAMIPNLMPPPQGPDPLVQIRQQELAIKQQQEQNKTQTDAARLDIERQRLQQQAVTDSARLELQEDIADERNEVNRERIAAQSAKRQ